MAKNQNVPGSPAGAPAAAESPEVLGVLKVSFYQMAYGTRFSTVNEWNVESGFGRDSFRSMFAGAGIAPDTRPVCEFTRGDNNEVYSFLVKACDEKGITMQVVHNEVLGEEYTASITKGNGHVLCYAAALNSALRDLYPHEKGTASRGPSLAARIKTLQESLQAAVLDGNYAAAGEIAPRLKALQDEHAAQKEARAAAKEESPA